MRDAIRDLLDGHFGVLVIIVMVGGIFALVAMAIAHDRNISRCLSSRCSVGRSPTYAEGRCICVEHAEGR